MNAVILAIAAILIWLGSGEHAISLAGWAAPVLLLRVSRDARASVGLPGVGVALALGTFAGFYGMSPGPLVAYAGSVVIGSLLEVLPYAMDRRFASRHSGLAATLPLPAGMVTLAWLASLGDGGTVGGIAYLAGDRLSQLAALGGIWPLVFLPYWVAACLNFVWEHRRQTTRAHTALVSVAAVVLVIQVFGAWRLASFDDAPSTLRAAAITTTPEHRQRQAELVGPVLSGQSLDASGFAALAEFGEELADVLFEATEREADAGSGLVVWSEAAVPLTEAGLARVLERASEVASAKGIVLGITPAVLEDGYQAKIEAGEPFLSNRLIMIAPTGEVAWSYAKSRLVPGYEQAAFQPGDGELRGLDTPHGLIVGGICFDADFPSLIRAAGEMGAAVLVVPSNDWLQIRRLHARVVRMRAVENGVAVLRPASSGLSLATDPAGRVVAQVDFFTSGGAPLIAQLPVAARRTPYSIIGDLGAFLCCGVTLVCLALCFRRRDR